MTRYIGIQVAIFLLLSGIVFLISYMLIDPNAEGRLDEDIGTAFIILSIIPLSIILLSVDELFLRKREKKYWKISFISAAILAIVTMFLVLRFALGIV